MNYWGHDWTPSIPSTFISDEFNLINFNWLKSSQRSLYVNGTLGGETSSAGSIGTMAGGGRISNVVGQGYLGAQVAELLIFNSLLNENSRQSLESYLAQKWGLSIPLVYRKFADHSGGHRDLVFIGDDQTENQKFGNSLGFDGKDDFAHIPLVNPSNGNLSPNEVTRFDLLHAWWPLDGNGTDQSGNERDGNAQNGASFSNGRLGQALDLSTGGTFIAPESVGPGILGDQARTVSLWVKTPRITSYHTPLLTWGNTDSNGNLWKMMLDFNDGPNGMLAIGLSGQRKTGGRYPLGDNMWRHLAVTLSEKLENTQEVSLFIDGYREELHYKNIDFSNFSIDTRSSDLVIGGDGFYGMIDDVRIYSDLLNPGEILRIYQESSLEDLNLYNSDYTLSVWVKPDDLPASNKYGFATGRFYWRNWGGRFVPKSGHRTKSGEIFLNSAQVAENLSEAFSGPD